METGTLIGTKYTVSFKKVGNTLEKNEIITAKEEKIPNPKDV